MYARIMRRKLKVATLGLRARKSSSFSVAVFTLYAASRHHLCGVIPFFHKFMQYNSVAGGLAVEIRVAQILCRF